MLVLRVRESEKYYLESISIEGNTKTQQKVIIRELALKPGDVFDYKRMQSSEKRLKILLFLIMFVCALNPTDIPGGKNLNVLVSESKQAHLVLELVLAQLEVRSFFLK